MKFLIALCLVASAVALPREGLSPGLAFVEDLRSMADSRIIQGQPASPGQFPHQAFLFTSDDSGSRFVCGGSLISPSWVVTAGHCLYGLTQAEVRLGSINYASAPVVVSTRNVRVHPNYNPTNLNNDIALIGLGQDVPLSSNVQPIKIASGQSNTFEGSTATVSGFGLTSDGGSVSPSLNWVDLRVISNVQCAQTYGSSVIISSTICGVGIQSGAQGSCNGDSGGPLIIGDQLVGIVSFGSSAGCSANVPSGFTRPNFFASWIAEVTGITI